MNFGRPDIRSHPSRRAFSLLELLIVMAIIMVMFTMYWGGGLSTGKTKLKNCQKNLEAIFVALRAYSMDNNGKFPSVTGAKTSEPVLSLLVPKSTTSTGSFICPASGDKSLADGKPFANARISYAYYMGLTSASGPDEPILSDRQVNNGSKLRGQLVFSPNGDKPGNNHKRLGGNVVFSDGSVQATTPGAAFNLTNSPKVVLLNPKL